MKRFRLIVAVTTLVSALAPALATAQARPARPSATEASRAGAEEGKPSPSSAEPGEAGSSRDPLRDLLDEPEVTKESEPPVVARPQPTIEEMVVTAQKREESLQDVPIGIDAFPGEDLAARGIGSITELQYATPGLVIDEVGTFPILYLRGVGTDAYIPSADTSVANYVDGVYFPSSLSLVKSFSSVERVEVVKGPQGTLFGRNATGGAINVVTREPSEHEYTGSIETGYGSFDHVTQRVYLSGPLHETVSFSLAGLYDTKNDPYDVAPESPLDHLRDERERAGAVKVRWAPGETFDATAAAYGFDVQGVAGAVWVNERPSPLAAAQGGQPARRDYEYTGSLNPKYFNTSYVGSLTANVRPGPVDVKSITAYQDMVADTFFELDGTSVPLADNESYRNGDGLIARFFTQELQFLSNEGSPLSTADLEWIAGFYFLNGTAGFPNLGIRARGDVPVGALPGFSDGAFFHLTGLLDTKSYAGFAQGTWSPLSWFDLTLGGRHQFEERRVYRANSDLVTEDEEGGESFTPINHFPPDSLSRGDFSPKVSIGVRPLEDLLLFASWQRAFKSGSFNIIVLNEPPAELRPEKITAIETGIKTDLFDGRVRFNASLFQNEIRDIQSQFISLQSGGLVQFLNAEEGTVRGSDARVIWAATPELRLDVGWVFLHGKYDEFTGGVGFDEETGLYQENLDFSGNRIVRNPKHTLIAALAYGVAVPGGTLELGGECYYNSGFYFDAQNITDQPGYYAIGTHTGYLFEPWNVRFALAGTNLNEARRYAMRLTNDFGTVAKLAPPRAFFGTVSWTF